MDFWALKEEASGSPYRPTWSLLDCVGLSGMEEKGDKLAQTQRAACAWQRWGRPTVHPHGMYYWLDQHYNHELPTSSPSGAPGPKALVWKEGPLRPRRSPAPKPQASGHLNSLKPLITLLR